MTPRRRRTDRRASSLRRFTVIGVVGLALVLSGCRVDITTTVNVANNGSGNVTVVVSADAAVLQRAPELATSLNLEDLRTAGWTTTEQYPTPDGGMLVTLERNFETLEEATQSLGALSGVDGPFRGISLLRTGTTNDARYEMTGEVGLANGLASFADAQALEVLAGAPFETALATAGRTIEESLGMTLRVTLPGKPEDGATPPLPREGDDPITSYLWTIPLDGTTTDIAVVTRDRNVSALVFDIVARVLLVLLIGVVVVLVVYAAYVMRRRSRTTPAP